MGYYAVHGEFQGWVSDPPALLVACSDDPAPEEPNVCRRRSNTYLRLQGSRMFVGGEAIPISGSRGAECLWKRASHHQSGAPLRRVATIRRFLESPAIRKKTPR